MVRSRRIRILASSALVLVLLAPVAQAAPRGEVLSGGVSVLGMTLGEVWDLLARLLESKSVLPRNDRKSDFGQKTGALGSSGAGCQLDACANVGPQITDAG